MVHLYLQDIAEAIENIWLEKVYAKMNKSRRSAQMNIEEIEKNWDNQEYIGDEIGN